MQSGARRGKMKKKGFIPLTDREAYQRLLDSGITKTEIARILGVSKQSITRWTDIPLRHVRKIAEATGLEKKILRPSDFG
jgi:hypothetical protein